MRKLLVILSVVLGFAILCGVSSAEVNFQGCVYTGEETFIDLGATEVTDLNAFAEFLWQMPNLQQVNMFGTKLDKDGCRLLANLFPNMKWGWTMILQGQDHNHEIRTDQTSFSTLHNDQTSCHASEDFEILRYCWNLFALDIGHNSVTDLSFLRNLPKLRVLILACNQLQDISPIASLEHLEYLEIFKNDIRDISPVTGLTHLLDLNACFNRIQDISPLKNMTWLNRLWLFRAQGYMKDYSKAEIRDFKAALPNTELDMIHYSTAGYWRFTDDEKRVPHYAVIVATFGNRADRPKRAYVPFDESAPFNDEELQAINEAYQTFGTPQI